MNDLRRGGQVYGMWRAGVWRYAVVGIATLAGIFAVAVPGGAQEPGSSVHATLVHTAAVLVVAADELAEVRTSDAGVHCAIARADLTYLKTVGVPGGVDPGDWRQTRNRINAARFAIELCDKVALGWSAPQDLTAVRAAASVVRKGATALREVASTLPNETRSKMGQPTQFELARARKVAARQGIRDPRRTELKLIANAGASYCNVLQKLILAGEYARIVTNMADAASQESSRTYVASFCPARISTLDGFIETRSSLLVPSTTTIAQPTTTLTLSPMVATPPTTTRRAAAPTR